MPISAHALEGYPAQWPAYWSSSFPLHPETLTSLRRYCSCATEARSVMLSSLYRAWSYCGRSRRIRISFGLTKFCRFLRLLHNNLKIQETVLGAFYEMNKRLWTILIDDNAKPPRDREERAVTSLAGNPRTVLSHAASPDPS